MSANSHVLNRLNGIQKMLIGVHSAGSGMSSATKGNEREQFIDSFLSEVLPPPFRFGTGDATDKSGTKSGQLDVVVEYPFLPSLPVVGGGSSRLYLAESVAAVIEVKSDISAQWDEVLSTANALAKLKRIFGSTLSSGKPPIPRIPIFAVGYNGWKKMETLKERLTDGSVDGILVINPGLFVSTDEFRGVSAPGPWALWGLIACLHQATSTLKSASVNPLGYAQ